MIGILPLLLVHVLSEVQDRAVIDVDSYPKVPTVPPMPGLDHFVGRYGG